MSYNGSGTFQINTSGQPVVTGTVISSSAFNALTADLATGLSTAITKDGQTATTVRIPFAQGINSSLATDTTSGSTGSIFTAGGVGIAKALFVGTKATVVGTLGVTGAATFSATPIFSALTASSAVATDASKNLVSVTNTGTGNNVLATSPTLVTPALGTPSSGVMTNVTGINYDGFKNRIINGAMVIDQRNAGASVSAIAGGQYFLDRWACGISAGSKFTVQQSSTAPAGFNQSSLITSSTAWSIGASDSATYYQYIEGYNIADLGFGSASASTVTLSFWVRSSLTGTFGGILSNSSSRFYPFTYTINAANTFEQKTITIAGDTLGTWLTTTGIGLQVAFSLAAGSSKVGTAGAWTGVAAYQGATGQTNILATNAATFYVTGVQLEKGSTATSFDYRPYGTELALCQRYALKYNTDAIAYAYIGFGFATTTTNVNISLPLPVQMRTAPTVTASTLMVQDGTTITAVTSTAVVTNQTSSLNALVQATVASGLTAFRPYQLQTNNNTAGNLLLSAEL